MGRQTFYISIYVTYFTPKHPRLFSLKPKSIILTTSNLISDPSLVVFAQLSGFSQRPTPLTRRPLGSGGALAGVKG